MSIGVGIAISPSFEGSHIPGVSALFSYPKNSYNQGEADPTPTITGTPGGTFSGSTGIVFVDSGSNTGSSTGQIDLSASSILGHTITYTVSGISSNFELLITAIPYQSTRSFSFDGVNDYFDAGNDSSLSFGTANFSVSCWFKTTQNVLTAADLVINGAFGGGAKNYALLLNSSEKLLFAIDDGDDNPFVISTSSVADGNWHHVVGVRDSVNINLYLDGSLIDSTADTTDTSIDSTNPLLIGAGTTVNTGVIGNFFEGLIDEVSIWDSALSSSAVTEIYNSGAGNFDLTNLTHASSSNLKAWLKMGE